MGKNVCMHEGKVTGLGITVIVQTERSKLSNLGPFGEMVYDLGEGAAELSSLPPSRPPASAASLSTSSSSCLTSSSSASLPDCVSVGTPLETSFSKYLGTNLSSPAHPRRKMVSTRVRNKIVMMDDALYAAPLSLGGLVPLTLLNDVLGARRL